MVEEGAPADCVFIAVAKNHVAGTNVGVLFGLYHGGHRAEVAP